MRKLFIICLLCVATAPVFPQNQNKGRGTELATSPPERSFKNLYALIIGISKYGSKSVTDLQYADKDAKLFFTYLKTFYGEYLEKDGELNYKLLLNEEATQAKVNEGLNWLSGKAKEGDLVIVYFAGHGNIEESNTTNAYFYCNGVQSNNLYATAIPFSRVNDELVRFTNRKVQAIFVADACHSGLVSSDAYSINTLLSVRDAKNTAHRLLSSKENQVSIESPNLCNGQGFFTYYLIKGLLGEADGSDSKTNEKDGLITIHEIETYLQRDLYDATGQKQTPQIITNDDKFIVGRKLQTVPEEFNCLLEQGDASGLSFASAQDDKDYVRKKLSSDQVKIYESFLKALSEKRFISPAQNNVLYFYELLRQPKVPANTLSEITYQWKVAFQEYAQDLIGKYLENGKIPTYDEYELGAALLRKCLETSKPTDSDFNDLTAKQIFLESYALHRKYSQYKLKLTENERKALYRQYVEKIKKAIESKPDAAYLHNVLGKFYREVGDLKNSYSSYTRASILSPNWAFPKYNLMEITKLLFPSKKTPVSAQLREYESMLEKYPDFITTHLNMAYLYRNSKIKQPQKSLEILQKALSKAKEIDEDSISFATIYNGFGNHYWSEKQYDKAEEYYLMALKESNNSFYTAYDNLATMYRGIQNEKALSYAEKGLAIYSHASGILTEVGWIQVNLKNYEKAEQSFLKSIESDTTYANNYYEIAKFYRSRKDLSKAEQYVFKAYSISKLTSDSTSQATYLTELATIISEGKEYDRGNLYFEQAEKINPNSGNLYYFWAFNFLYTKRYDQAINLFQKSEQLGGDYDVDEAIGYIKIQQEKYDEAMIFYKKALRQYPKNTNIFFNIADIFNKKNQKDSALFYIEKSIFLNEFYVSKQYEKLYEYFISSARNDQDRTAYYALGLMWEQGIGRQKNLNEARKWFTYAHQMVYWPATTKLISYCESGKISGNNSAHILSSLKKADSGKKFTIPCLMADGSKVPFDLYTIDYPFDETAPIGGEVARIKEIHNAIVPEEVITSFNKLFELARKNNVGFGALCVYALEAANKEKSKPTENVVSGFKKPDFEEEALKYNSFDKADSVFANIERAIIDKYSAIRNMPFDEAYNFLVQSLSAGVGQDEFLIYYLIGNLYENSSTNKSNGKAIKWYSYAFQMGYKPAYFRLKKLFRYISESKVAWLDQNADSGSTSRRISLTFHGGQKKDVNIYLMDYPVNPSNPLQQEEERIKDVYGATIPPNELALLKEIYQLSEKEKVSFQSLYKRHIEEQEKKKLTPIDQQYVDKGLEFYNQKKYAEARQQFSLALKENIKNARAYYLRGLTYVLEKDMAKGIEDMEIAVKFDPDNGTFYRWLGAVYIQVKNYEKAQTVYEKAYELGMNTDNGVCYDLACLHSLKNRRVSALRFFEESLKNGFNDFDHIQKDTDLDNIRELSRFKELVARYLKK